jgi:hypothetical protein
MESQRRAAPYECRAIKILRQVEAEGQAGIGNDHRAEAEGHGQSNRGANQSAVANIETRAAVVGADVPGIGRKTVHAGSSLCTKNLFNFVTALEAN